MGVFFLLGFLAVFKPPSNTYFLKNDGSPAVKTYHYNIYEKYATISPMD